MDIARAKEVFKDGREEVAAFELATRGNTIETHIQIYLHGGGYLYTDASYQLRGDDGWLFQKELDDNPICESEIDWGELEDLYVEKLSKL